MIPSDADRISSLTKVGKGLVDRVEKLTDELASARKRWSTVFRRSVIGWLILSSIIIGLIFAQVQNLISEVLCPYFSLVVGSYDPESRPEGPARALYVEQFGKIRVIFYEKLECTDQLVPPRSTPMGLMVNQDPPGT